LCIGLDAGFGYAEIGGSLLSGRQTDLAGAWPRRAALAACARLDVKPVVLLRWESEERLAKRALNCTQRLLIRLFFLGPPLSLDKPIQIRLQGLQRCQHSCIPLIVDDAAARAGCEVQERHVDKPLQITGRPGRLLQPGKCCEVLDDSGPRASKRDPTTVSWLREIELGVCIAERRANCR
jgi:hypothetical protein